MKVGLKRVSFFTLILAAILPLSAESSSNNIEKLQQKILVQSAKANFDNPTSEINLTDEKTNVTFFNDENAFHRTTRKELLEKVELNWQTSTPQDPVLDNHSDVDLYENALFDRANRIIIPRVRFINTPLSRVIESLANLAEINDPTDDSNERGINIVLLGMESGENEPVINLNLKNIPFCRLVELIAQSISYQFDITKDAVIIYKHGMAEGTLDTQFFPISRATLVRLTGIQGINHHMYNSPGSPENVADEERAIKEFFQRAGINFKDIAGSNLAFDGSQIIVTNTGRNLRK
jgi:general secretion pathway protein D